jgi:glycosyltransferase involved in cell wall biosynthesis
MIPRTPNDRQPMGGSERDVAVVIPCHNYGRYLAEAIASALGQTVPPREIIVVDDASTDDSADVAARFPVRYLRHERPRGAAAARNTGWRAASAPLVAFLDADDAWLPAKLQRQLDALAQRPRAGLVYCDLERVDGSTGRTIDRWSRHMPPQQGWVWHQELKRNFVQTSAVLVPRSILAEAGGFDESFAAWEDIDLWVRIARRHPFAYVPEPLVRYRMHGQGLSNRMVTMAECRLRSTRRALAGASADGAWKRRVLASCYRDMGVALYLTGSMRGARRWLMRALTAYPPALLERHLLATYVKTMLGAALVEYLRARRRGRAAQYGT